MSVHVDHGSHGKLPARRPGRNGTALPSSALEPGVAEALLLATEHQGRLLARWYAHHGGRGKGVRCPARAEDHWPCWEPGEGRQLCLSERDWFPANSSENGLGVSDRAAVGQGLRKGLLWSCIGDSRGVFKRALSTGHGFFQFPMQV